MTPMRPPLEHPRPSKRARVETNNSELLHPSASSAAAATLLSGITIDPDANQRTKMPATYEEAGRGGRMLLNLRDEKGRDWVDIVKAFAENSGNNNGGGDSKVPSVAYFHARYLRLKGSFSAHQKKKKAEEEEAERQMQTEMQKYFNEITSSPDLNAAGGKGGSEDDQILLRLRDVESLSWNEIVGVWRQATGAYNEPDSYRPLMLYDYLKGE